MNERLVTGRKCAALNVRNWVYQEAVDKARSPITGLSGPNLSFPKPAVDGGEAAVTIRDNESSITRSVNDLLRVFERLPEHRRLAKPFA